MDQKVKLLFIIPAHECNDCLEDTIQNIIKFNKGWVKSFCPKAITIDRYPSKGPFKSELEMKAVLSNAKSD